MKGEHHALFFWQGGLHIKPESDAEGQLLTAAMEFLKSVKIGHGIESIPTGIIQGSDHETIRFGADGLSINEAIEEIGSRADISDNPLRE